jgi:hypothetical protein
MRINTDDEKEYHTGLYDRTAERFGVDTKSGGIWNGSLTTPI